MKCKTFNIYLREVIYFPKRESKFLADKRLTLIEKKIIKGYLNLRDNNAKETIKDLERLTDETTFIEAHRRLLLGICYIATGDFALALSHLEEAKEALKNEKAPIHYFSATFNYFMALSNLGRIDESGHILNELRRIKTSEINSKQKLTRCEFIFATDTNDFQTARNKKKEIDSFREQLTEPDSISQLICEFILAIKEEDFSEGEKVLFEMKKYRKFSLSDNFIFMKRLLGHLLHNSPIYAYEREFTHLPILFHQIKVIEHLEANDRKQAEGHWKELQKISLEIFQEDFMYVGGKCLFSLCLEKHLSIKKPSLQILKGENKSYVDKLRSILITSNTPIQKNLLYELVYDSTPESKDDLTKLTKLVNRLRTKEGLDIISRKGTYFLQSSASTSSSLQIK